MDESIISWQEWDTSIKLAKYFKFGFVPKPLFVRHCRNQNSGSQDKYIEAKGYYQIVEKHEDEIIAVAGYNILLNHYFAVTQKFIDLKAASEAKEVVKKIEYHLRAAEQKKQICQN